MNGFHAYRSGPFDVVWHVIKKYRFLGSGAAAIADTINSSGAGVNAQAKLTTTIAGIDASSSSTIEIKKGGTAVDKSLAAF